MVLKDPMDQVSLDHTWLLYMVRRDSEGLCLLIATVIELGHPQAVLTAPECQPLNLLVVCRTDCVDLSSKHNSNICSRAVKVFYAVPCWLHHPRTCLACRQTAGALIYGLWSLSGGSAQVKGLNDHRHQSDHCEMFTQQQSTVKDSAGF